MDAGVELDKVGHDHTTALIHAAKVTPTSLLSLVMLLLLLLSLLLTALAFATVGPPEGGEGARQSGRERGIPAAGPQAPRALGSAPRTCWAAARRACSWSTCRTRKGWPR